MARKRMTGSDANIIAAIDFILDQVGQRNLSRSMSFTISEELVETLNGNKLPAANKTRLIRVIQLLKRRQEVISQVRPEPGDLERSRAFLEQFVRDAFELNEMLLRYNVSPQIDLYALTPRVSYWPPDLSKCSRAEVEENMAVMRSLQLGERDELDSVRDCKCGKFFLATRIDQQYCSAACRVKSHQSSEEFKAKRRKADRDRYKLHQRGVGSYKKGKKNVTHKTR
jgi:hypothetical protein